MQVGDTAQLEHTFTQEEIEAFAELSGDKNPIHLDPEYAATTIFKKPVVYGGLLGNQVSCLLGNQLPGPGCVTTKLVMNYVAPVYIGEKFTLTAKVTFLKKRKATVSIEGRTSKLVAFGEVDLVLLKG